MIFDNTRVDSSGRPVSGACAELVERREPIEPSFLGYVDLTCVTFSSPRIVTKCSVRIWAKVPALFYRLLRVKKYKGRLMTQIQRFIRVYRRPILRRRLDMLRLTLGLVLAAVTFGQGNAAWSEPFPPHKIAGNLYYVGSKDLASYLVTTPQGHILISSKVSKRRCL